MLNIGPEKAVLPFKTIFINLLKCLEIIFNTLIILGVLWFSGLVYGRAVGHGLFSMKGNE